MRRGEIYLVDFEPTQGAEARGVRPAVMVSNEGTLRSILKANWGVVNVVPMTSNVSRDLAFNVIVPADQSGLDIDSRAQAEQVRAVSIGRVGPQVGYLSPHVMGQVDEALRRQLVL